MSVTFVAVARDDDVGSRDRYNRNWSKMMAISDDSIPGEKSSSVLSFLFLFLVFLFFLFLGFPVDAFLFSLLLFLILLLSARWLLSSPANHIRLNLTDSQKKNLKKNKKKRSADHSVRWGKLSGGGFRERKGGITFFFFSFFVFRDSVEWRRYLRCRDQFRSTCPLCPQPLSLSLNVQYT